jgi:transketolase
VCIARSLALRVWEPVLLAPHLNLTNLTLIIDYNKIQSFGITNEVINLEPLSEKFKSFNWEVFNVDGHNFKDILTNEFKNCIS